MAPAPIFVCPTSELPICPLGKPTSIPDAFRLEVGQSLNILSSVGVSASAIALPNLFSLCPNPSNITNTNGFLSNKITS